MSRGTPPPSPELSRQRNSPAGNSRSYARATQRLGRPARLVANILAPALVLLTPLVGFLSYHRYDLWRTESLLSIGAVLLAGLAISAMIAIRAELLRPAAIGLLLVLFLDMQFRPRLDDWNGFLSRWHFGVEDSADLLVAAIAILTFASLILCWFLRAHLGTIISCVFGTMVLSTLLLPTEGIAIGEWHRDGPIAHANLPPVIHLILDEQIGPAGLPEDIVGGPVLRSDMKAFYRRFGFVLFPRAYSQYYNTLESISNLMNGDASPRYIKYLLDDTGVIPQRHFRLQENAWFDRLSDLGYKIRVYQTDYLDFCAPGIAAIAFCRTVPSNSIHSLMKAEISPVSKASLILSTYLSDLSSVLIAKRLLSPLGIRYKMVGDALHWLSQRPRLGAISALATMDRISRDMRSLKPGTAIFAHLLLPHGAYIYDATCTLRPDLDTWLGPYDGLPPQPTNTPATRRARYMIYFEQVRCTQKKLGKIFEAMQANGTFSDALIIVHGDHGSRISLHALTDETLEDVSRTDLIDSYSTLFALRGPSLATAESESQQSIQRLFAASVMHRFEPGGPTGVYSQPLPSEKANAWSRRVPMPQFGD